MKLHGDMKIKIKGLKGILFLFENPLSYFPQGGNDG